MKGNFTAQSPLGRAKEIGAVADHLNEVLTLVGNQNDAKAKQAEEMVSLEVNEAVWPHILRMIHEALPLPDADMAKRRGRARGGEGPDPRQPLQVRTRQTR